MNSFHFLFVRSALACIICSIVLLVSGCGSSSSEAEAECCEQLQKVNADRGAESVVSTTKDFSAFQGDSCNHTQWLTTDFEIRPLPNDQLPYNEGRTTMGARYTLDDNGIPITNSIDRWNNHPIHIAQYGLRALDLYQGSGNASHVAVAEGCAEKLIGIALAKDSCLYFPYGYNFQLHHEPIEEMVAPWYSSMTQGQVLSLMCRLHDLTGKAAYKDYADRVFRSLQNMKGFGENPWFSCVDSSGNLWFEEYPRELPCHTLNGMIYTVFGIYDFYQLTQSENAARMMKGALHTLKGHLKDFRNEGDVSYYCLKHRVKSKKYHRTHIRQLGYLYAITGDSTFKHVQDDFLSDTEPLEAEEDKKVNQP